MTDTWAGIISTHMMNVKNGWRSLQSYAVRPYAVSEEKYTTQAVAPTEMINELRSRSTGLKLCEQYIQIVY